MTGRRGGQNGGSEMDVTDRLEEALRDAADKVGDGEWVMIHAEMAKPGPTSDEPGEVVLNFHNEEVYERLARVFE